MIYTDFYPLTAGPCVANQASQQTNIHTPKGISVVADYLVIPRDKREQRPASERIPPFDRYKNLGRFMIRSTQMEVVRSMMRISLKPLHHVFCTSLSVRKARVLRIPFHVDFLEVFHADVTCLHDSSGVGEGRGFTSNAFLVFTSLSGDAGFESRGK